MTKKFSSIISIVAIAILVIYLISVKSLHNDILAKTKESKTMKLTSTAFKNREPVPAKYTCDGKNISPELLIGGVPEKANNLVLIVDDPDAPMGTFTHWIMYNIPAKTTKIPENIEKAAKLQDGILQGLNDFKNTRLWWALSSFWHSQVLF